jgi:hypothetical protein
MIRIVLLIIVGSRIHNPVHRRLIDKRNEGNSNENDDVERTWYLVSYSSISYQLSLPSSTIDYSL